MAFVIVRRSETATEESGRESWRGKSDTSSSIRIIGPWFPLLLEGGYCTREDYYPSERRAEVKRECGCACVCTCLRDTCIYSTRAGQSRPAGKVLREMDGPIFYFATPSGHAPSGYPHIICIYTHIFAASCESHGCGSVNARTRNFPSRAHGALRDVARFPCAPGQKRVENHAGR